MDTNKIITIGRQYGSMGRQIGKKLADDLGIGVKQASVFKEKYFSSRFLRNWNVSAYWCALFR